MCNNGTEEGKGRWDTFIITSKQTSPANQEMGDVCVAQTISSRAREFNARTVQNRPEKSVVS